ncbi:ankyrin [Annulohypoxylon bovei var. microspora]|nr:ankyrin [Annulohypoxylon bovei var. microspora]
MGLLELPLELILGIAENLTAKDILKASYSCRSLYAALNPFLYQRCHHDVWILRWAVQRGKTQIVRKLLEAGADPNRSLVISKWITFDQNILEYETEITPPNKGEPLMTAYHNGRLEKLWEFPYTMQWTALHLAASLGHDDIVELLLDNGANIDALSFRFCSCTYLIDSGSDLDTKETWWTPLHVAICFNRKTTVRLLVARGASFQVSRKPGSWCSYVTALHTSCLTGALDISSFLMNHYQEPIDIYDLQGLTPLARAYYSPSWATTEFLIRNGANIEVSAGNNRSLFIDACFRGRIYAASRFLELGADPYSPSEATSLHYCCAALVHGDVDANQQLRLVESLLEKGLDIHAKAFPANLTPLAAAAARGTYLVVKCLLEAGASVDALDNQGETPLMKACSLASTVSESWLSTIRILLERGASTTIVNERGYTALEILSHSIERHDDMAMAISLLIEYGSPLKTTYDLIPSLIFLSFMGNELDTCLYLQKLCVGQPTKHRLGQMVDQAIERNDIEGLRFLLNFKETVDVLHTETRLFKVLEMGHQDIAEFIFDAGAPWTHVSMTGQTCLLYACGSSNTGLVRKLLEAGADPNHFNIQGQSPLSLAIRFGVLETFETLLDHGADPFPNSINVATDSPRAGVLIQAILFKRDTIVEAIMERGLFDKASAAEKIRSMYVVCCGQLGRDSTALLRALLRGGVDPNMRLLRPRTFECCLPLQVAISRRNQDAVELLYNYGASL